MSSSTNRKREGLWLDLQWEVADTLVRCDLIAEAMPLVLEAIGSALGFDAARLWQLDGEELRRVSEWTSGTDQAGSARGGFVFPVEGPRGALGSVELIGAQQRDLDERLERLLILIGRQIGERLERDRAAQLRET